MLTGGGVARQWLVLLLTAVACCIPGAGADPKKMVVMLLLSLLHVLCRCTIHCWRCCAGAVVLVPLLVLEQLLLLRLLRLLQTFGNSAIAGTGAGADDSPDFSAVVLVLLCLCFRHGWHWCCLAPAVLLVLLRGLCCMRCCYYSLKGPDNRNKHSLCSLGV